MEQLQKPPDQRELEGCTGTFMPGQGAGGRASSHLS